MKKNIKLNTKKFGIFIGIIVLVILILLFLLIPSFQSKKSHSPQEIVEEYLKQYQKVEKSVTSKISYPFTDTLTDSEKEKFQYIMEKQYQNLSYSINEVSENEYEAVVSVTIQVIDFASAYEQAEAYIGSHQNQF